MIHAKGSNTLAYGVAFALLLLCLLAVRVAPAQIAGGLPPPPGRAAGTPSADNASPRQNVGAIPEKNLLDIMKSGGLLMWPILFCSIVMLVFVFERAIALRRGNILPRPFVKNFLLQLEAGQLDQAEALARCEENGSPIAQVFAAAVRKWGRSSVEVEQAMLDAGERVVNTLRRNLRVLNTVSTVSPLLGLLGTVFGMIQAFNDIAAYNAMGRSELLAGGISQALLTTAGGLAVAIPALLFHMYFVSCVDRRTMEIDSLGQQVVECISSDSPPKARAKAKKAA
jgi:biopolymer transport protein ExbB